MKNFKSVLVVTLILDVIQFIPLVLVKMGGDIKNQIISDFNIEGLASSAPSLPLIPLGIGLVVFSRSGGQCSKEVLEDLGIVDPSRSVFRDYCLCRFFIGF